LKNSICLNSNTYHGYSIDDAIEGAYKSGYSYIELAAVRGYTEHVLPEMSDEELNTIKKKLSEKDIECIAIAGHSNLMEEDGVKNFEKNIELAKRMGSKFITTATGETHDDDTEIADENVLINTLKSLAQKCQSYHIDLVIETHGNNYATGKSIKDLAEKVNEPNFGITYDTANVLFYGNEMPYEDLESSADKVKFVHLKDKLGADDEWHFPAIGKGNFDMNKIFGILKETDCQAPISIEVEFTSSGPKDLAEVDQAVNDSMQTVKGIVGK